MLTSALMLALTGAHALQPPGMFHDGEAVARHGERWLALRAHEGDARLDTVRLRVKRVIDEIVDAEGEATGQQVESDATDVVTYLRGPGLHAGNVVRADIEALDGAGPVAQTLRLHGHRYRIETRCKADDKGAAEPGSSLFDCSIDLIDGARTQTLVRMPATRSEDMADGRMILGDDASPRILFAGDLDRDGKLDLLFDASDHYNLVRPVLFLSGAAEGDELLHAVAEHRAVGC